MKQITAESLMEMLSQLNGGNGNGRSERPLIINNYSITGILKKVKIEGVHFIDCQFFNFGVVSSLFSDCKFIYTKITHTNFEHTQFSNCAFQDSSISSTTFIASQISTTKIANVIGSKIIFDQSEIQYTKFTCNSLIATKFLSCKFLDVFFEYNTLDASVFDGTEINNSMFFSSNMRGVHIVNSRLENTLMDYINFDDSANTSPSEFFIPARDTSIRGNEVVNLTITNTVLKKTFKDFVKYSNKKSSTSGIGFGGLKSTNSPQAKSVKINSDFASMLKQNQKTQNKELKNELKKKSDAQASRHHKDIFPHNASLQNIASAVTFFLQLFLTLFIVSIFKNFHEEITLIFYKSIPNIIKFPMSFIEEGIEIHQFAFYFSLLYFAFSGILLCVNVACIRGVNNLLLSWLYRGQSFATFAVLCWIYWHSLALQSAAISMLNLVFASYFFIMIIQSFKTSNYQSSEQRA